MLAGVDDANDEYTSLAGVHDIDTSLAGVAVPNTVTNTPVMTNTDDNLDTESDHNSVDSNEANDISSKASIYSTRSHICIHSATSEPPQHPADEKANLSEDQTELNDIELPKLETQDPVLHQSERVSVAPSDYIPQMGGKTYVTNVQTGSNQDIDVEKVWSTTIMKPESWQQSSLHSMSIWSE